MLIRLPQPLMSGWESDSEEADRGSRLSASFDSHIVC